MLVTFCVHRCWEWLETGRLAIRWEDYGLRIVASSVLATTVGSVRRGCLVVELDGACFTKLSSPRRVTHNMNIMTRQSFLLLRYAAEDCRIVWQRYLSIPDISAPRPIWHKYQQSSLIKTRRQATILKRYLFAPGSWPDCIICAFCS